MTLAKALRDAVQFAKDNPSSLIGGTFAVSENGILVNPKNPTAKCFCALGLLYRHLPDEMASPSTSPDFVWAALNIHISETDVDRIYEANDAPENRINYDRAIGRSHVGLAGVKILEELANELDQSPHSC